MIVIPWIIHYNGGEKPLTTKLAMKVFPSLALACFFMLTITISGQTNEPPTPGTQTAQSVQLAASTSIWPDGPEGFMMVGEPRPIDESKTETVHYWLFLPTDYAAQTSGASLLLFLHGRGERGNTPEDLAKVKAHGPPKLLDNPGFAKNFPAIAVSPQCKDGFAWSPAQLMLLLDHIEANYKIDRSRIYVTGLSMGGFGTWMCLNESPGRFAAAAPICGGGKPEWAGRMLTTPIWAFHGDQDTIVPAALSTNMVQAIRNAVGRNVLLTVYEGEGHDSWTRTYDNQLLYDWMFQQSLRTLPRPTTEPMVELPIRDGEKFTVTNVRGGENETFSLSLWVQVRRRNALDFERAHQRQMNEVIDRITTILSATTTQERSEIGYYTIKAKVQKGINDVLGTPWVQQVFIRDPSLTIF